ncbi:hypothetical protein BCHO_1399 [Bifidobacterium choerinum]|uniref:Uncharacterized protein n=1 Tax=Bifidobacterium choerinum TaxID=35760 RepID=A0A087ABW7_9BIFI|nr:hypothetical protein BCHO_1399 [Bifidobacterium choerinum]
MHKRTPSIMDVRESAGRTYDGAAALPDAKATGRAAAPRGGEKKSMLSC